MGGGNQGLGFGIRALLGHIGYNMWCDKPRTDIHYGYSTRLRFEPDVYKRLVLRAAKAGFNMIILDLGDGIAWKSHPEIAVENPLKLEELDDLLKFTLDAGIEPIPKLNFSTVHDIWLGPYERMVGTERYHQVCAELISEAIELFHGPRFFHIGMDEETLPHHMGLKLEYVVLRLGSEWVRAVERFNGDVRRYGSQAWIWGDCFWKGRGETPPQVPRDIIISDWQYGNEPDYPSMRLIEELGYKQVPAGSNWSRKDNLPHLAAFALKNLKPEGLLGIMQTVWHPMVSEHERFYEEAIDVAAPIFKGEVD